MRPFFAFSAILGAAIVAVSPTAAHATPVLYTYENTSGFSLAGIGYPVSHNLGLNTYMLHLYLVADTSQAVTTPGTNPHIHEFFTAVPIISGVVGYGNTPLASITDSLEFQYRSSGSYVTLFDLTRNAPFFSTFVQSPDGIIYSGDLSSSIDSDLLGTDLGPLTITAAFSETMFFTTLNPASIPVAPPAATTPEPAGLVLFGTGVLSLLHVARRRRRIPEFSDAARTASVCGQPRHAPHPALQMPLQRRHRKPPQLPHPLRWPRFGPQFP